MWRFDGDTMGDTDTGDRTPLLSHDRSPESARHVTSGLHFADFKKTRIEFSIEIDF